MSLNTFFVTKDYCFFVLSNALQYKQINFKLNCINSQCAPYQTPESVYVYGFRTRTRFFEWARITYVFRTCISQIDRHQLCLRTSFLEITRTQLFIRTWFLRFTRTQFCLRTGVLKLNPYTIFFTHLIFSIWLFPRTIKNPSIRNYRQKRTKCWRWPSVCWILHIASLTY